MVSKTVSILDSSVVKNTTDHLILSLKISNHCFETAVLDSAHSTVTAIECWNYSIDSDFVFAENVLEKIIEDSSFLKKQFEKIIFLPDHHLYTLIPDKLFHENESKKYLVFNHGIDSNEKINVDHLQELQLRNIYWQPYELAKSAEKYFTNVQYSHLISSLIRSFLKEKNLNTNVLINYCGKRMDVIAFKESQLVFCNSFFYESPADMIYFLLNIFQQTSINASVAITLTGEIAKKTAEYEIISSYFSNVSFAKPPLNYNYYQELLQLPLHKFYGILNSFRCAL
jgi:hypothetical protein